MDGKVKSVIIIGSAVFLIGTIAMSAWIATHVRVSRRVSLVPAYDECEALLGDGASLDKIEAAAKRVGMVANNKSVWLYSAVARRREDVAEWLLKEGTDPNGHDGECLYSAVGENKVSMVILLMRYGADPDRMSGYGDCRDSPRRLARRMNNRVIIALFDATSTCTAPGFSQTTTEPSDGG